MLIGTRRRFPESRVQPTEMEHNDPQSFPSLNQLHPVEDRPFAIDWKDV
jgi:hypothetical protein